MNYDTALTLLLAALLLQPLGASAAADKGKRRPAPAAARKPAAEEPQEDPRTARMLAATQRVVFIDSVVVDKADFLQHYHLGAEAGRLTTYGQFFKPAESGGPAAAACLHANELGNRALFALGGRLHASDRLGQAWGEATPLPGIGPADYPEADYPFAMADGTTLYFAAKGEESLGGYDIFVTRYNSATGAYLRPENIGMPFNSPANDYMYAVDETDSIGYFATDRNQPPGRVCVYTFIPPATRRLAADEADQERLRSLARIDRIRDTWGFAPAQARRAALARLEALRRRAPAAGGPEPGAEAPPPIVIADSTVYTSAADFKSPAAADSYRRLVATSRQLASLHDELDQLRSRYAAATGQERQRLGAQALQDERRLEQLQRTLRQLEKAARNEELLIMNYEL